MKISYPHVRFRKSRSVRREIDKLLTELRSAADTGLHLGAGYTKIENLINCDLYNPNADMQVDSTDLKEFENSSVDYIESHHMIEHLSFTDTDRAMADWNRVLKDGGLLVITCPDLTGICFKWLKYIVVNKFVCRAKKMDYVVQMLVGSQENEGMFHRNAFDKHRAERLFTKHGFDIEFFYSGYPRRTTPSMLIIARKKKSI